MSVLDRFRLDGKTALVTGSRRGIGQAIAVALADAGADIIGVSAQMEASGSELEQAITARGRKITGYACDFADRDALYQFITRVTEAHPTIDILVNNAGIIVRVPAADFPDTDWDKVLEVNLTAQFILTRELGKRMVARGSGKVIFIASILAFQGGIFVPAYAASKGGVAQLAKAFSNEWAGKGVQVNAIAPGYVETDTTEALVADQARYNAILQRIPAGRWAVPEDLQGPAVFLASSASDYISGEVLTVDGGWMGR